MRTKLVDDLWKILTLFAGFAIGIHVAVFLHELGHAIGYWISGGAVTAIEMMAPAPTGRVVGSTADFRPVAVGGVFFGSLCTLVPLLLSRYLPTKSALRFTALMVASFCLAHNGLYLFVGGFLPFGDAQDIIRVLGAPQILLILLGLLLLTGFIVLLASSLQSVGAGKGETLWRWILIVELGLVPVPLLTLVDRLHDSSMRLYVVTYALCFALAAFLAWQAARVKEVTPMRQDWQVTIALYVAAVLVIVTEWLAFRPA